MRILVLNAGSSSLKASVVEPEGLTTLARTSVDWGADATRVVERDHGVRGALAAVHDAGIDTSTIDAVGHRVVHGGSRFVEPVRLDADAIADLDELQDLAPLHNAVAVAAIRAARAALPDLPHLAVFDTAFHRSLPESEVVYPLPWSWYAERGIRRYGFHGSSVGWSILRASELLGRPPEGLRVVVAHLGSGCSVTAVDAGRSVWTSMGMTPLEGLMMGTRSGSVDPGVLLSSLREGLATDVEELGDVLDHGSGLLGVSGVSGEMRLVRDAAEAGDQRAVLARTMFVARAAAAIGAAATALPRLDALVFTGGIGEHDGGVRSGIVERLATIGIARSDGTHVAEGDTILSGPSEPVAVLCIEAREDLMIGREVVRVLGG